MSHVVPPLLMDWSLKCGYLLQMDCQTSESMAKCIIWQPLVFPDMVKEVSRSCRNVVFQRGSPLCYRVEF